VRGQGLPREDGSRGDFYVLVQLQVPPAATPEERGLWEKLAAASSFNPRKIP